MRRVLALRLASLPLLGQLALYADTRHALQHASVDVALRKLAPELAGVEPLLGLLSAEPIEAAGAEASPPSAPPALQMMLSSRLADAVIAMSMSGGTSATCGCSGGAVR